MLTFFLGAPRRQLSILSVAALTLMSAAPAWAAATPGQSAPNFQLRDVSGKTVGLADFKGKTVVLEWVNPNCPFVKKHYVSKNMQGLQTRAASGGVVWLAINSTNPKHEDYLEPAKLSQVMREWGSGPTAVLMDPEGQVGKLYGARTTPHMYIIDPTGQLVYAGGIDDKRSANPEDVKVAKNFVSLALDDLRSGRGVSITSSAPYGCSVKYN
jgi:cytochrome oxidase Cu insertion factor (SCO1/SenC/PrrC family)